MKQFFKTFLAYFIITFVWATFYNEVLFDNALNEMAVGWRDTPLFQFGFLCFDDNFDSCLLILLQFSQLILNGNRNDKINLPVEPLGLYRN